MDTRRISTVVQIGEVTLGGGGPVIVQSMTDTDTSDVSGTVSQVTDLIGAGSEMVRLSVNTPQAARSIPAIVESLEKRGLHTPLIGDFHYNGHKLLCDFPDCAQALMKYRINPGNMGGETSRDSNFARMIEIACRYHRAVRIGGNLGSLDPSRVSHFLEKNRRMSSPLPEHQVLEEVLIDSVLHSARKAEDYGLGRDRILVSAKISGVPALIRIYRRLAAECDYSLHLGLTEAGPGDMGIVASTAAISILLQEGIGDTIRVSLTPSPGTPRTQEVRIAQKILQAMGLRFFSPRIVACPGCGRTNRHIFQQMTSLVQQTLEQKGADWSRLFPGSGTLQIAVMGCVVNGPGESRHADIGISLPGSGEDPKAVVYRDGKLHGFLEGGDLSRQFIDCLEKYMQDRFRGESETGSFS